MMDTTALWDISERVSNVIRSYMPTDGSSAADSRIMGLLNDLAHDVHEEIMSEAPAVAAGDGTSPNHSPQGDRNG